MQGTTETCPAGRRCGWGANRGADQQFTGQGASPRTCLSQGMWDHSDSAMGTSKNARVMLTEKAEVTDNTKPGQTCLQQLSRDRAFIPTPISLILHQSNCTPGCKSRACRRRAGEDSRCPAALLLQWLCSFREVTACAQAQAVGIVLPWVLSLGGVGSSWESTCLWGVTRGTSRSHLQVFLPLTCSSLCTAHPSPDPSPPCKGQDGKVRDEAPAPLRSSWLPAETAN